MNCILNRQEYIFIVECLFPMLNKREPFALRNIFTMKDLTKNVVIYPFATYILFFTKLTGT